VCEPEEEEEGVDIVVPEPRCLLETVESFSQSHNDWQRVCVHAHVFVASWPAFGEHHIDIIVIDIRVEKRGDYV